MLFCYVCCAECIETEGNNKGSIILIMVTFYSLVNSNLNQNIKLSYTEDERNTMTSKRWYNSCLSLPLNCLENSMLGLWSAPWQIWLSSTGDWSASVLPVSWDRSQSLHTPEALSQLLQVIWQHFSSVFVSLAMTKEPAGSGLCSPGVKFPSFVTLSVKHLIPLLKQSEGLDVYYYFVQRNLHNEGNSVFERHEMCYASRVLWEYQCLHSQSSCKRYTTNVKHR